MRFPSVAELVRMRKDQLADASIEQQQGELHKVAARALVKVLWGPSAPS